MKTWELKAETMTTGQLDRWLAGKIPRRHLAIPFGGPIKGRDLDGEFFDADTDLYGPLRQYGRERLVDWHHVTFAGQSDPVNNAMKGAILGRIVLDPEPSEEDVDAVRLVSGARQGHADRPGRAHRRVARDLPHHHHHPTEHPRRPARLQGEPGRSLPSRTLGRSVESVPGRSR
jgi:hypothetical protein